VIFHKYLAMLILLAAVWIAMAQAGPSIGGERNAVTPTTGDTTQPAFQTVDYHARIYLQGFDRHVTISKLGEIRCVTQPYTRGPIKRVTGQLTREEMIELATFFNGWEKLKRHYPSVVDGGSYSIRYGQKTVGTGGGPDMPEQFEKVRHEIERLVAEAAGKESSSTRPSSKPSTTHAALSIQTPWYMEAVSASPHVRQYAARMNQRYSIVEVEIESDFVILDVGENRPDHFIRVFSLKVIRSGLTFVDTGSGEWQVEPRGR
jgi:hypothetical protein